MKIATVGPRTYFENHTIAECNDWETRHFHTEFNDLQSLRELQDFSPDLSIFYRPELYPVETVEGFSGKKIAFYTEPISAKKNRIWKSSELKTRNIAYSFMKTEPYHRRYLFDKSYLLGSELLKLKVDFFSPLPINEKYFQNQNLKRNIDICFIGKPTAHRVKKLDQLRWSKFNFKWIAHGVQGREVADLFNRSKVVLNLHADEHIAGYEPRIDLAVACGSVVASEKLQSRRKIHSNILQFESFEDLNLEVAVRKAENEDLTFDSCAKIDTNLIVNSMLNDKSFENEYFN
jgi:hypothetical protein